MVFKISLFIGYIILSRSATFAASASTRSLKTLPPSTQRFLGKLWPNDCWLKLWKVWDPGSKILALYSYFRNIPIFTLFNGFWVILRIFLGFRIILGVIWPQNGWKINFGPKKQKHNKNSPYDTEKPNKNWNEPQLGTLEPGIFVAHRRRHQLPMDLAGYRGAKFWITLYIIIIIYYLLTMPDNTINKHN